MALINLSRIEGSPLTNAKTRGLCPFCGQALYQRCEVRGSDSSLSTVWTLRAGAHSTETLQATTTRKEAAKKAMARRKLTLAGARCGGNDSRDDSSRSPHWTLDSQKALITFGAK